MTIPDPTARDPQDRGFVWLDSATDDQSLSVVAWQASQWLEGSIWSETDFAELQRRLLAETPGMAIGAFDYDGAFTVGIFPDAKEISNLVGVREVKQGLEFQADIGRADFERMVGRALEYIAAGDIYQVNLSQRFTAGDLRGDFDSYGLYTRLRAISPAPMAAFLQLPDGRDVLSASMETFLKMEGRAISTCPIKGTRPRSGDPARDEAARRELSASPKERAELVMITDLERNDLGQVCEYGSVHVPRFLEVEEYAQVFHQVSEVRGTLREGVTHLEALRACFPGGSITGAPKKRAREIIAELEPVPRGLYTGAIGYFGLGENAVSQWSIAIRTLVIEPPDANGMREAHFHVGAGIVADSDPAAEYQETLDKAAGILLAAKG